MSNCLIHFQYIQRKLLLSKFLSKVKSVAKHFSRVFFRITSLYTKWGVCAKFSAVFNLRDWLNRSMFYIVFSNMFQKMISQTLRIWKRSQIFQYQFPSAISIKPMFSPPYFEKPAVHEYVQYSGWESWIYIFFTTIPQEPQNIDPRARCYLTLPSCLMKITAGNRRTIVLFLQFLLHHYAYTKVFHCIDWHLCHKSLRRELRYKEDKKSLVGCVFEYRSIVEHSQCWWLTLMWR